MRKVLGAVLVTAALGAGTAATVSAQSENAVTILHGIPGITVDLRVDGEVVIAGFDAGDTQDFTPLAGTVLENIVAVRAGSDEVVIGPIDSFTVPDEGNVSVVVHLNNSGEPTITPFPNSAPPTDQGRGLLTVRHVADAAPVAVTLDGEEVLSGISNGGEGGVVLPAGEIVGASITADGAPIAAIPTLLLEANTQLIVYVGGSLEAQNLAFYLQQISAGGIESVATPMATEEQTASGDATDDGSNDGADDGTPQPDAVNTGDAGGGTSRAPATLFGGLALVALAGGALAARRELLIAAKR